MLVAFGACAKSEPQAPEHAAGSPETSSAAGGATSPSTGAAQDSPAKPAADGGKGGGPAPTASDANTIHLPPTGGRADAGPGQLLTDVSTQGSGVCAGVTAASVIAAMQSAHPELADIPSTREPGVAGDESFVFAYLRNDGSFALIVKRGDGDCVAGCIDNTYWYFETNAMCQPQQVGHFSRVYTAGNCYMIEGWPEWEVPATTAVADQCFDAGASSNTEDAGTADLCEEQWDDFSMQLRELTMNYLSCTSDDDCDIVGDFTGCQGSCGALVNRQGLDAVANLIATVGAASCEADGVRCPTRPVPPCISRRAVCVDKLCSDAAR